MSVRYALLGLLVPASRYGYQLRADFEKATGSTWPLNVGQVYSTLARLERDGLIASSGDDGEGHVHYESTAAGREEFAAWLNSPVSREAPPRDELAVKLAVALTLPGVDVHAIIAKQRAATLEVLQGYTRLKRQGSAAAEGDAATAEPATEDVAWSLVLESLIFNAEAEVRWLDYCEARLKRLGRDGLALAARPARLPALPDDDGADAESPPGLGRPESTPSGATPVDSETHPQFRTKENADD